MIIKKTMLTLALGLALQLYAVEPTYNPKTTEIFWDIHKVIIKKSKKEMFDTFCSTPNKCALLLHIFNWGLLKDIYSLLKSGSTGGAFVERLKQDDPRLANFALNMANSQILIEGMEDLILSLADQGYTMHVASNIGTEVFERLKEKYPHIFNDNVIKDGKTVDFRSESPVEKPDGQFFIELSSLRDTEKSHAIFIDDKQENIDSAHDNGFIGILFKNAEELSQALHL